MTTEQLPPQVLEGPCRPLDRQGIREAAEIRRRYLLWLVRELRKARPYGSAFNNWQLMVAAAEALEQVAS